MPSSSERSTWSILWPWKENLSCPGLNDEFCSKITMAHAFHSTQSTYSQHGMRSGASYRARITAIFANSTRHPILNPPSSAGPHNHAPHGISRYYGESGPVVALHARARTLSCTRTRTHTHTVTRTARHTPPTTAHANLHAFPHAHSHQQTRMTLTLHAHVHVHTNTRAHWHAHEHTCVT